MKYPHTGLYQFCLQLSRALLQTAQDRRLCFYVPPAAKNVFGPDAGYRLQSPLHKVFFPSTKGLALWHCTHQGSDYFPFGKKLKKVLTLHDLNYGHDESKSGEKRIRFFDTVQRKVDAADAVIAISQYSLADAQSQLNLEGKRTGVIYNGCNIRETLPVSLPADRPSRPFLFSIGAINPKKNFHVLPRLLPRTDFELVIAGLTQNAAYKEKIEEEAMRLGVEDRLRFAGPVSEADKQWYLKNCAAFVFPSVAEGFGLPVVEAMYYGKPLLLSASTSLPEIGGDTACYFSGFAEEEMQKDLAACLNRYANDASLADGLRQRALSFSWTEAAKQYHRLYDELLKG